IGELRSVSDLFRRRSVEDPLTGLANRAGLAGYLGESPSDEPAGGAGDRIDPHGLQVVNRSPGPYPGAPLLAPLARRPSSHARAGELLARAGGDEFVLIARGVRDAQGAQALADRLLQACAEPFDLDGAEAHLSVSVGAAPISDTEPIEASLRNADLALFA